MILTKGLSTPVHFAVVVGPALWQSYCKHPKKKKKDHRRLMFSSSTGPQNADDCTNLPRRQQTKNNSATVASMTFLEMTPSPLLTLNMAFAVKLRATWEERLLGLLSECHPGGSRGRRLPATPLPPGSPLSWALCFLGRNPSVFSSGVLKAAIAQPVCCY